MVDSRWGATWKDKVEQARAVGRDPYAIGIPRGDVERIIREQDKAMTLDMPQDIVDDPCGGWDCPCGNQCERTGNHRTHRCGNHRWTKAHNIPRRPLTRLADTERVG